MALPIVSLNRKRTLLTLLLAIATFSSLIGQEIELLKPINKISKEGDTVFSNKDILGEWVSESVTYADGSKVPEDFFLRLHFLDEKQLVFQNLKFTQSINYKLTKQQITYNSMTSDVILSVAADRMTILTQSNTFKVDLVKKHIFDYTLNPYWYVAKNGQNVYARIPNYLEPVIISSEFKSPMQIIYENFDFPQLKNGGFVVRFIVTKEGNLEEIRIEASSHKRFEDDLRQAVIKTKGKWTPAKYKGEYVNCEVIYDFNLKPSDDTFTEMRFKAMEKEAYGDRHFNKKEYLQAIKLYNESIALNPMSTSAYYKRASVYVLQKDMMAACANYEQLTLMGQKKAENLFYKYCGLYRTSKKE